MTPEATDTIDLDRLGLHSGQGQRIELPVQPGGIELGANLYSPVPEAIEVTVDISRTVSGYALRLRFAVAVSGPCMRCLEPASPEIAIDAREVDQPSEAEDPESADEGDLLSPYVEEGVVDVGRWARDALVLALPDPILCSAECPGLCSVCGRPLAGSEPGEHDHGESLDPRWAKLRELGGSTE